MLRECKGVKIVYKSICDTTEVEFVALQMILRCQVCGTMNIEL